MDVSTVANRGVRSTGRLRPFSVELSSSSHAHMVLCVPPTVQSRAQFRLSPDSNLAVGVSAGGCWSVSAVTG